MTELSIAGVAFDLDGTLIDTEPRNRVMWSRLFDAHGAPYDEALIASFAGRRGREALADLIHLFPGRGVEELFLQAVSYENDPDLPAVRPVPGAVELVRALHGAGVPVAVVTSGMRGYATGLLDALGVRDLLELVVTADDVTVGKPHPEGFLAAARGLDLPPGRMVAFEDAPAGVAAVKAAGMTCVAVTTTQPPDALAAADRVVADLLEIAVLPGPALRVPGS
ncbi:HAD family hydrolase [Actinomadura hibisca]|uniref:HAD family hydrolase n=1 Tax=Actinomadura hibisca TaxID=68565 RepID=UPI000A832703|nr:HAD family phosphatase [Actinomadura hibisca]